MANRRMFSLDVVATDKFIELPVSAQCLYFHLGMRADDDGNSTIIFKQTDIKKLSIPKNGSSLILWIMYTYPTWIQNVSRMYTKWIHRIG